MRVLGILASAQLVAAAGLPPPPEGFKYLVNADDAFIVNADGAYFLAEA